MRRGLETAGEQLRQALASMADADRCVQGALRRAEIYAAGEPAELEELRDAERRLNQVRADVLQILNDWQIGG